MPGTAVALFEILEDNPSPQLMYLGLRRDWSPLTGYAAAYYTILWKFILIQYTRVDTDDAEFDERYIMTAAATSEANAREDRRVRPSPTTRNRALPQPWPNHPAHTTSQIPTPRRTRVLLLGVRHTHVHGNSS